MKSRRLAAAFAVAVMVSGQGMGTAAADSTLPVLGPAECQAFSPTAGAAVPQAWHLERLKMQSVWELATGEGVDVAVIDTGVSTAGTTFFSDDRMETYNLLGEATEEELDNGGMDCAHGTAVASLIAAGRQDTGKGLDVRTNFAGIAPGAHIVSYRVLRASAAEGESDEPLDATVAAIRDAIARDVDVINLSQSAGIADPLIDSLASAVNEALASGIVVVAAAGNTGDNMHDPSFPGAFPGVISVGISTRTDGASLLSLPGENVTVGAPGEALMGLKPSNNLLEVDATNQAYDDSLFGTSFAAPIVSGVVALMLERNPTMTPDEVRTRLMETADPPPSAIPDPRLGHGIINPMRALTAVTAPTKRNADADADLPVPPLPTAEDPDMVPAVIAVSAGVGALVLATVGLVATISIPRAVGRTRQRC